MIQCIYTEISQDSAYVKDRISKFPNTCPLCGAKTIKEGTDYFNGPIYGCGGQYTFKPQIQNHTDKWWGSCPVRYMEELESKNLLDGVTVWVVKENGRRKHIATFSEGSQAEQYGRVLSFDYPRFWNDESRVVYIEILGSVGVGATGLRFRKGKMVAKKSIPRHIEGAAYERVWFKVEQISLGSSDCLFQRYKSGDILVEDKKE